MFEDVLKKRKKFLFGLKWDKRYNDLNNFYQLGMKKNLRLHVLPIFFIIMTKKVFF